MSSGFFGVVSPCLFVLLHLYFIGIPSPPIESVSFVGTLSCVDNDGPHASLVIRKKHPTWETGGYYFRRLFFPCFYADFPSRVIIAFSYSITTEFPFFAFLALPFLQPPSFQTALHAAFARFRLDAPIKGQTSKSLTPDFVGVAFHPPPATSLGHFPLQLLLP